MSLSEGGTEEYYKREIGGERRKIGEKYVVQLKYTFQMETPLPSEYL